MITRMIRLSLVCIIFSALNACSNRKTPGELLTGLKEDQAKISLIIDGRPFYSDESIFRGSVIATDNFFRMNLTDQFESNVIIALSGTRWYAQHPIRRQVSMHNQAGASVMIGKLINKMQRQGEGYLMAEGRIEIESLSDERIVLRLAGKVNRYGEPTKLLNLTGSVVYKTPPVRVQNINKAAVYY